MFLFGEEREREREGRALLGQPLFLVLLMLGMFGENGLFQFFYF